MTEIPEPYPDSEGGPAFPAHFQSGNTAVGWYGLSTRDWFAGMALQGLLSSGVPRDAVYAVPDEAYRLADSMIEARKAKL